MILIVDQVSFYALECKSSICILARDIDICVCVCVYATFVRTGCILVKINNVKNDVYRFFYIVHQIVPLKVVPMILTYFL